VECQEGRRESCQAQSIIRRGEHGIRRWEYMKGTNIVLLDPDVAEVFPDSRAVNEALRVLARVAKRQAKRKPKKTA